MRTAQIEESLVRSLSSERLERYLAVTNGELGPAIDLYERNTRLAEALYTPLQCLEICFRNTLHQHLSARYTPNWHVNSALPLQAQGRKMLNDALKERISPASGDVIAELKFAFWVSLLGRSYDATLWRQCLYKGFQSGRGRKRSDVHGRLNAIRRFRNRVAHHEPIYDKAMQMHGEIIEAIGWMCLDTQQWAIGMSRFHEVYNLNGDTPVLGQLDH